MACVHCSDRPSTVRMDGTRRSFGIKRSFFGWLSVRFSGGPSYPQMVEVLQAMAGEHGHLIKRGECLSGSEWLYRISASGAEITGPQLSAVETLMG